MNTETNTVEIKGYKICTRTFCVQIVQKPKDKVEEDLDYFCP